MEISGVSKSGCALGGDLLIQVLNAAWHSDSWREMENIHFDAYQVLAQTHSLALLVHSLQENACVRHQSMHRQCCAILFAPDACCIIMPTSHLELDDADIPVGCARIYGSKLSNCPLCLWFKPQWWAGSKLRQHHLDLAPHLGSKRLFRCVYRHVPLFFHSFSWWRWSYRHQPRCAFSPFWECHSDCCLKVVAIL